MSDIVIIKWIYTLVKLTITWVFSAGSRRFKRFVNFKWLDKRRIKIIVAETYAPTGSNIDTTCEGIRATGEGQLFGLFYLLPHLANAYGIENIELSFADKSSELTRDDYELERKKYKLVILGGPINNNYACAVMKYESPQFTYRCMLPNDCTQEKDFHVLIDRALGHSINRQESGTDYGLIVQVLSPVHKGFDVLLLSGNTTKGTAAAALAVSSPEILKQIISRIEHDSQKHHNTTGGCFYIKVQGRTIGDLELDIKNSKYGKLHWS